MITRNLTNSFIKMRTTHFSKFNSNDTDNEKTHLISDNNSLDISNTNTNTNTNNLNASITPWLRHTDTAKELISQINHSLKKLDKLFHDFFIINFTDSDSNDIDSDNSGKSNNDIKQITNLSKKINNQCVSAKNEILQANSIFINPSLKNEINLRKNIINNLIHQLDSCSKQFKKKEKNFMAKYKSMIDDNLKHDIFCTLPDTGSLPLIDIEEGEQNQIKKQIQSEKIKERSNLINQRDYEIQNLSKSVHEVSQLFQDFNLLTIEQGSIIDQIESNCEATTNNVDSGVVQLKEASTIQKKARPILCYTFIFVLILIIVIVIIVLSVR